MNRGLRVFAAILSIFIITSTCFAQEYHWSWAASGRGGSEGMAVCTDPWGNVFGLGESVGTISFGNDTLTGVGGLSCVVVKYDNSGNLVWVRSTQNGDAYPCSIATDASGNLYLIGYYKSSSINVGSITLGNSSPGKNQLFLAKYDPSGGVGWAINLFNTNAEDPSATIATAGTDIYLTANFTGAEITVGGTTLVNTEANGISMDVAVIKVDAAGNIVRATSFGGKYDDMCYGLAVSQRGNLYIGGVSYSPLMSLGDITISKPRVYIAKFDVFGTPIWAHSIEDAGNSGGSLAVDADENVFLTGLFDPNVSLRLGMYTLAAGTTGQTFVAKYSPDGDVLWAQAVSGSSNVIGFAAAVDPCGNVWISGSLGWNGVPGSGSNELLKIGSFVANAPANSADPMFLAGWSKSGKFITAQALPTGGDDVNGIATDGVGNVYIGGDTFMPTASLGSSTLTGEADDENMFVAKFAVNVDDTTKTASNYACLYNDTAMLYGPPGFLFYRWNDGGNGRGHIVNAPGTYWVYCTGKCGGGIEIDTFAVSPSNVDLLFSLGRDTITCSDLVLQAPIPAVDYLWQDSSVASHYIVKKEGIYTLTVSKDGCSYTDSIAIEFGKCPCKFYLPNTFTPNNDGKNDDYFPFYSADCFFTEYSFSIYNRWGQRVFFANDPGAKWDGNYAGNKAELGTYMYYIEYKTQANNKKQSVKGDFMLIR